MNTQRTETHNEATALKNVLEQLGFDSNAFEAVSRADAGENAWWDALFPLVTVQFNRTKAVEQHMSEKAIQSLETMFSGLRKPVL